MVGSTYGSRAISLLLFALDAGSLRDQSRDLHGPFSYLLILWVLTQAPASYVLGLRQTSLIFGVLFGRFLLQERETGYRIFGAGTIAVGGLLIATAK